MKFSRASLIVLWVIGLFFVGNTVFGANIDAVAKYSQFTNLDLDNNAANDVINWSPTGYGATVTDTGITGYIWGATTGWINLNPTNGGVDNTCDGELSGYAWGQNAGWINFSPTNAGVTIDTTTGEFDGHAWSQNYGWIEFTCPGGDTCVTTTWLGCAEEEEEGGGGSGGGGSIPAVHICNNGIDDDSDGLTDYPSDPGCVSSTDNSEQNVMFPPIDPDPIDPPDDPTDPDPIDPDPTDDPDPDPTGPTDPTDFPPGGGDDTPFVDSVKGMFSGDAMVRLESLAQVAGPIGVIVATAGILSTLPGFAVRAGNALFSIPFFHRRRPWGIVYDANTKEPLDPVYVTVYNVETNQVVDTRITDINGRYGFLLPKGTFRIDAQKTHYRFPSQTIPRQNSDGVYDNLYFGDPFTVSDDSKTAVVTLNIPMDQIETDWNQEEKRRMGIKDFFMRNTKLWARVSTILFMVGFVFSTIAFVINANYWNGIIFIIYIFFGVLQITGFGPVSTGVITDASGNPVPHAVVRVWNAHLGNQIAQRIADASGRYYLLVAKGDYYVTVDTKNSTGGFDRVFTSETLHIVKGIINKNFQV